MQPERDETGVGAIYIAAASMIAPIAVGRSR
jgi:hypothetical protein